MCIGRERSKIMKYKCQRANNPVYEPMRFTDEEIKNTPVRIIGRVVELRAKF